MNLKRFMIFVICLTLFSGCAMEDHTYKTSDNFPNLRPSVIAIMPVTNETVDLDAPKPFPKFVRTALLARGYQVAEPGLIEEFMKKEGFTQAGQINAVPDKELGQTFGAQALLFTTVTAWETSYLVAYSSVTVGVRFDLIDAKTSELIWRAEDEEKDMSLALDRDSATATAAFAAFQAYEPYAKKLVFRLLEKLPEGPFGSSELPKVKIKKIQKRR